MSIWIPPAGSLTSMLVGLGALVVLLPSSSVSDALAVPLAFPVSLASVVPLAFPVLDVSADDPVFDTEVSAVSVLDGRFAVEVPSSLVS